MLDSDFLVLQLDFSIFWTAVFLLILFLKELFLEDLPMLKTRGVWIRRQVNKDDKTNGVFYVKTLSKIQLFAKFKR